MSQRVQMKYIQLIIYIGFLFLLLMKIRKIKIQGTLPKMGVWLPTLLAMHAQTNLNQGLLQVPPPSHLIPASLFRQEKRSINIKCNGRLGKVKESSLQLKGFRISS